MMKTMHYFEAGVPAVMEELDEINLGFIDNSRLTYMAKNLDGTRKQQLISF